MTTKVALLLLVPVLAQCQGSVEALRSDVFVPFAGHLQVWHNPGYTADELWFPAQGVRCVVLRELDPEDPNRPTYRWRMHAHFATSAGSDATETVQVPSAIASRIFALARATHERDVAERELAEAALAAGLVRDLSEVERFFLQTSRSPTNIGSGGR